MRSFAKRDSRGAVAVIAVIAVIMLTAVLTAVHAHAAAPVEDAGMTPENAERARELDLPPRQEIDDHKSFDPSPKLQRTPGGSLIVDAFIMDGPVRVEIRNRDSDELLLEKRSETLFSFELQRAELGAEPEDVVVRIYVDDTLAHELELAR